MSKTVVIFILLNGQKILIEKRFLKQFGKEEYLIPGGTVENHENLEMTLKRELMEELGIVPLRLEPLGNEEIPGLKKNIILKPFLIHQWLGNLPEIILDQGNQLIWIDIDEALKTPVEPTRKILSLLRNYLINK